MPIKAPPYAGVICPIHGPEDIDKNEYIRQMNLPNEKWTCPKCRAISEFNDERYEELHPEPEGDE